jgi:integrase
MRKMATFRKMKTGWRAEIARQGVRKSKMFQTKQEARDWAASAEQSILQGETQAAQIKFGDLMDRYRLEVSPKKRGARWEEIRLLKLARDPIAQVSLGKLDSPDFVAWRDQRLREVAPASVVREMQIFTTVLNVAVREWKLLPRNPILHVRKPSRPPGRDRLPSADELSRLLFVAGGDLTKLQARAHHAFRFAIETAMRSGEICGMVWGDVDLAKQVVTLPKTKNGDKRQVPLSRAAVALLEQLPSVQDPRDDRSVFGLTDAQRDALWRKNRDKAGIADLTFHDSRHAAITMLAKKLDVMDLARMVGHRNINQLLTYYNAKAEDLATRLG